MCLDLIITSLTESVVMTEGDFAHSILPSDKTGTDVGCHLSYLRGEQKVSEWDWRPTNGDSLITDWTDSTDLKFRSQIHMADRHPFVVGECLRSSCERHFKRESVEIHSCYKLTSGRANVGAFRKPTVNRVNGEVEALKAVAIKIKFFGDMAVYCLAVAHRRFEEPSRFHFQVHRPYES